MLTPPTAGRPLHRSHYVWSTHLCRSSLKERGRVKCVRGFVWAWPCPCWHDVMGVGVKARAELDRAAAEGP